MAGEREVGKRNRRARLDSAEMGNRDGNSSSRGDVRCCAISRWKIGGSLMLEYLGYNVV